ncbi:MAG: hypothetical protein HN967_02840 [Candidatus Marinimicrobia bacterium]|nr:hypothetical protein [Candidatus Neomarinimicrobiota bacterium]
MIRFDTSSPFSRPTGSRRCQAAIAMSGGGQFLSDRCDCCQSARIQVPLIDVIANELRC